MAVARICAGFDVTELKEATQEEILDRLANGEGLVAICNSDDRLPNRSTVQRWQDTDADFDAAVTRAREIGMHVIAEQAVADALVAEDAAKGRLAFDARRWYVGKLSNAFADKTEVKHSGSVSLSNALDQLINT